MQYVPTDEDIASPTADIMKPLIQHFNEMQEERLDYDWHPECHFATDWFAYHRLRKLWTYYDEMEDGFEKHQMNKYVMQYAGWHYQAGVYD